MIAAFVLIAKLVRGVACAITNECAAFVYLAKLVRSATVLAVQIRHFIYIKQGLALNLPNLF